MRKLIILLIILCFLLVPAVTRAFNLSLNVTSYSGVPTKVINFQPRVTDGVKDYTFTWEYDGRIRPPETVQSNIDLYYLQNIYTEPGNYYVAVSVTDAVGNTAYKKSTINIYDEDVIARAINSGLFIAAIETDTLNINIWPGQMLELVSFEGNILTYQLKDNLTVVTAVTSTITENGVLANNMGLVDWAQLTATGVPYFDGLRPWRLSFVINMAPSMAGEFYTIDLNQMDIQ